MGFSPSSCGFTSRPSSQSPSRSLAYLPAGIGLPALLPVPKIAIYVKISVEGGEG